MASTTQAASRSADLITLCQRMLRDRRLLMLSNRGPVEHELSPDGRLRGRRGNGGVITALSSLTRYLDFTWIASAISEGDRKVADLADMPPPRPSCEGLGLRYVVTPEWSYDRHYNVFCNPLLWFIQHGLWRRGRAPDIDERAHDAWQYGYVPVNQAFADAVVAETSGDRAPPYVMVHDYHLYLVPMYLRRALPGATISHFVHIPWPGPASWMLLPGYMRRQICRGLSQSDILGFQCDRDARAFLETCREFLPDARVDDREQTVSLDGHRAHVRSYPISIDVRELQRVASSRSSLDYARRLKRLCLEKTIVRVDRVDPTKNILRGFQAYRLLLERHPELRGRVTFLAFLVPSRTGVEEYRRYADEVRCQIRGLNASFGRGDWTPVHAFFEEDYPQAVAGLGLYDVLLVNSVIDGMNLVAKEGPVVNTRSGALVLSRSTGAYQQLRHGALDVDPLDIDGTERAMYRALSMPARERAERSSMLAQAVEREDVRYWLRCQVQELMGLSYGTASPSHPRNSSTSPTPLRV